MERNQIAVAYSVATAAAMFCDGVALAFFPGLYGNSAEYVKLAGAVILWGAAVGIALAVLRNRA